MSVSAHHHQGSAEWQAWRRTRGGAAGVEIRKGQGGTAKEDGGSMSTAAQTASTQQISIDTERLMRRVEPITETGCWIVDGFKNFYGYGFFSCGGRQMLAHRASWELHYGAIPSGFCVLHKCDIPDCVNPAHLYLGTLQQNVRDRDDRGRAGGGSLIGSMHPSARLTLKEVIAIKRLRAHGIPLRVLSEAYGVSESHISKIFRGKTWNL